MKESTRNDLKSQDLIQMIQSKVEEAPLLLNPERVQVNLSLLGMMTETLQRGRKVNIPNLGAINWEPGFNSREREGAGSAGQEETEASKLAKRNSNNRYKTLPCRWYHSSLGCDRGEKCDFIHDYNYKGVPPPFSYKAKKNGTCSRLLQSWARPARIVPEDSAAPRRARALGKVPRAATRRAPARTDSPGALSFRRKRKKRRGYKTRIKWT